MQKLWYQAWGFEKNPLRIVPTDGEFLKVDEILPLLTKGSVMYVQGRFGTGKTSLMQSIIKKIKGQQKLVYFSCHERKVDFEDLLLTNFFRKLFSVKAKGLVLLLDEMQDISDEEAATLITLYKEKYFRAVLLAGSKDVKELPESLQGITGNNVFVTGSLTLEQAIALAKQRLGEQEVLTRERIEKVYQHSSNPREFLQNLEDYCRRVFEATTK